MEEILVIGATGNIGLPVAKSLVTNPQIHVKAGVHNVAHAQQVFPNELNEVVRSTSTDNYRFRQ